MGCNSQSLFPGSYLFLIKFFFFHSRQNNLLQQPRTSNKYYCYCTCMYLKINWFCIVETVINFRNVRSNKTINLVLDIPRYVPSVRVSLKLDVIAQQGTFKMHHKRPPADWLKSKSIRFKSGCECWLFTPYQAYPELIDINYFLHLTFITLI